MAPEEQSQPLSPRVQEAANKLTVEDLAKAGVQVPLTAPRVPVQVG